MKNKVLYTLISLFALGNVSAAEIGSATRQEICRTLSRIVSRDEKWKKETGKEPVAHGIRVKLAEKKQEIQNEQKNTQHTRSQNKDRGAR